MLCSESSRCLVPARSTTCSEGISHSLHRMSITKFAHDLTLLYKSILCLVFVIMQSMYTFQLVFLSFCRGELGRPRHNRTNESWECTAIPRLSAMYVSAVGQGVDRGLLHMERQLHPFPSVDVPVNCYICFSTLPDSL